MDLNYSRRFGSNCLPGIGGNSVLLLFARMKGWNTSNFNSSTTLTLRMVLDLTMSLGLALLRRSVGRTLEQVVPGPTGRSLERISTHPWVKGRDHDASERWQPRRLGLEVT